MSPVVGEATLELRGDAASLERTLRGAQRTFDRVGRSMQRTGRMMSRRITLPLLAVGGASVTVAARFEESMSRIEGLVGIASDQVNQWGRDILELAPKLGRAPQELAEGLFFVTSAGFRGAAAMDVLEQSARAAAAGLGETRSIADAVTSAVNAYGIENLNAGQATDILTAAVREGKLEAQSLAPVLGNLLPTASAMNISFEQVAGMLAVFSRTGADAASGAVTLNRLMLTLQKNTGPAVDMLEDAGLSLAQLRDIASGPEGLIGVMRLLARTFSDDEEALAQLFPNIRAFRGVMNALAQDADTVDSVLSGVANSAGSADRAFEAASSKGFFKLRQAMVQLQATGIRIGSVVMPAIADVAQRVAGVLSRLTPQMIRTGVAIGFVAGVLGPLVFLSGTLVRAAGALVGVFGKVAGAFSFAFARLRPFVGGLVRITGLINPVTVGLAGISAAIVTVAGGWEDVGRLAGRAFDVALRVGRTAMETILRVARGVINAIVGLFRFVGMVAVIVWEEFVRDPAVAAFQKIKEWAEPILSAVAAALEHLGRLAEGAAEAIRGFFADAAEGGEEEGAELGSRIASAAVTAFGTDYVGAFVDVVVEGVERARALIERAMASLGGGAGTGGVNETLAEAEQRLGNLASSLEDLDTAGTRTATGLGRVEAGINRVDRAAFALERGLSGVLDSLISSTQSFGDAIRNMADVFIREVNRMLAKAAALAIIKTILGGPAPIPGGTEGAFGISIFGDGGFMRPGEWGIVGERGPELVQAGPRGATVTPNEALQAQPTPVYLPEFRGSDPRDRDTQSYVFRVLEGLEDAGAITIRRG